MALGKTLGEIDALPNGEFEAWREFFVLYPFDDLHRYHRPAALVAHSASMGGMDIESRIRWLQPEPWTAAYSEADIRTMAAFGVKPPPRN